MTRATAGDLEVAAVETELEQIERGNTAGAPKWPWVRVLSGALIVIGLAAHGYMAFATLDGINARSKIDTPNPVVLFRDVATNGPRVPPDVEVNSRNSYGRSLTQFVLNGTGLCVGLTLVVAGLFVRAYTRV